MDERLVVVEFLQGMPVGSEHYFNMCQGGGAMVERVDAETYDLYEIPYLVDESSITVDSLTET